MYIPRIQGIGYRPFTMIQEFDPTNLLDAQYIILNEGEFTTEEIDEAHNTVALSQF